MGRVQLLTVPRFFTLLKSRVLPKVILEKDRDLRRLQCLRSLQSGREKATESFENNEYLKSLPVLLIQLPRKSIGIHTSA